MQFRFTRHSEEEMRRRQISRSIVESVLEKPQQIVEEYGNKKVYQSKIDFGGGKVYLVRVVVDDTVMPKSVITVYRTGKIEKYWREP